MRLANGTSPSPSRVPMRVVVHMEMPMGTMKASGMMLYAMLSRAVRDPLEIEAHGAHREGQRDDVSDAAARGQWSEGR
jgi:hypothetical protein